jgi:predicted Zn-dependent peptidase
MYRAAGAELYDEPFRGLDETLALIDAIEPETIANVCRDFYAPERQSILSLGPRGVGSSAG